MSRCDYDAVFYRVFCITLLAIALIFTLILTNVFVDIDGLLSKKHGKSKVMANNKAVMEDTPEPIIINNTNYDDGDDSYRNKRSIETQNILFHIKNPKIKHILTNRLENLLESLDAEENDQEIKAKLKPILRDETKDITRDVETIERHKEEEEELRTQKDSDMLYLTIHNILLQGIIGHMDLKEVYKKVGSLMVELNNSQKKRTGTDKTSEGDKKSYKEKKTIKKKKLKKDTFTEKLIRSNKLQKKIADDAVGIDKTRTSAVPRARSNSVNTEKIVVLKTQQRMQSITDINLTDKPSIWINTVIDIKSNGHDENYNVTAKNENIQGIVELIFNGKSIKFSRPDADTKQILSEPMTIFQSKPSKSFLSIETTPQTNTINVNKDIPTDYLNEFVAEYLKHFPNSNKNTDEFSTNVDTKRLKRHVKIKFAQNEGTPHIQRKEKIDAKKTDDELYVEIETHFDSKGLKGEKKKKLIRDLVNKIQKAIHSGETTSNKIEKQKISKQLHVRKRIQNPLKSKKSVQKHSYPVSGIVHRQLNPIIIPKVISSRERLPNVRDKSGEAWKKNYVGPSFLTAKKSINSAEMSELDVDYNRVLDVNGIPQRLQKPLNTDMSEETMNVNSIYDLGNMKFFIKDIDGSGFSIGYNQYVDEPPDVEAIKLFTGLENVIKTYHQNYDDTAIEENADPTLDVVDDYQQISNQNDHLILRRSIDKEHDYHSNEYLRLYDSKFLPYNSYKDVYERKISETNTEYNISSKILKKQPLVVDANIFDRNLKPAEIFGLANLFERKKRSVRVKKISNIKNKIKLNRFLNTKAMATKRIFLNKKRSKRQINKIRIIASDFPRRESSDENVFLASNENLSANRATVNEAGASVIEPVNPKLSEYSPYQTEETEYPAYKIFDGKFRHNSLMSKYPHIFMEEITRSREELTPDDGIVFNKISAISNGKTVDIGEKHDGTRDTTSSPQTLLDVKDTELIEKSQQVQDIVEALQRPKAKYKVTVKIVPKNLTSNLNSGFKEIHTSINKSFNKNGVIYSSLVNVSEISKITKINKKNNTKENQVTPDAYLAKKLKDQEEKMHSLLRQQRKHIDEQLLRLSNEKSNLESILVNENNTIVPHFDYMTAPSMLRKILHLSKDELNKLAEIPYMNISPSTTTAITTTKLKTSTLSTKIQSITPPEFIDSLKKDILRKIERSDNLTDEILKKIDKNTEILQTFLKKLTENVIDFNKPERRSCKEDMKTEKPVDKIDVKPFPIDCKNHHFNPNMSTRRNETHLPLVYPYQQPMLPHKIKTPIASVVYHGHMHTHVLHNKDISSEKKTNYIVPPVKITHQNKEKEPYNQTRFFIDELESDYKVIPVLDSKKILKNGTVTQ